MNTSQNFKELYFIKGTAPLTKKWACFVLYLENYQTFF